MITSDKEDAERLYPRSFYSEEFGCTLEAVRDAYIKGREHERAARAVLVEALEIIAGKRQCIDGLMSHADVAREALRLATEAGAAEEER